jgi:hypothetical protein
MISIEKSVRTCKVNTDWALRAQSDRFLNSNEATCPVWNGQDSLGRTVCENSYYTKAPGCNSSNDRVVIENELRPQYYNYVNLDAYGLSGNFDNGLKDEPQDYIDPSEKKNGTDGLANVHKMVGQFGNQYLSSNRKC